LLQGHWSQTSTFDGSQTCDWPTKVRRLTYYGSQTCGPWESDVLQGKKSQICYRSTGARFVTFDGSQTCYRALEVRLVTRPLESDFYI
jgi:hypothetical protein